MGQPRSERRPDQDGVLVLLRVLRKRAVRERVLLVKEYIVELREMAPEEPQIVRLIPKQIRTA